jgi:hypothetical protein
VDCPRAALGNLKTAFAGIYHAFGSAENAARYLADARFCMNRSAAVTAAAGVLLAHQDRRGIRAAPALTSTCFMAAAG